MASRSSGRRLARSLRIVVAGALALAAVAPACGNHVVATMAAVAAEVLAEAGETEAARRAAEQACRSDGHNVRALLVLARLATAVDGRVAQAAVERAMESAGPSAQWCSRLSDILEQAGDPKGAVGWARRRVALRPGEPAAAQALVARYLRETITYELDESLLAWAQAYFDGLAAEGLIPKAPRLRTFATAAGPAGGR